MLLFILRWILVLIIAAFLGKLVSKVKMPSILGWLIAGMLLGPHAVGILPQQLMDSALYKTIITWMQVSFGLMLGTELIFRKIREYGKALLVTTLTQSLGTFLFVSLIFGIFFRLSGIPLYLAFALGGIALATAPAPALSIVQEFHTRGPVTDALLPMAILDDIVGIAVFFSVSSFIAHAVSDGSVPLYMIPVMILLPIGIGLATGIPAGLLLRRWHGRNKTLTVLISGITVTASIGLFLNHYIFTTITLNYMLMGVSFSAALSNMVEEDFLNDLSDWFQPILGISLLTAIVDLGAPLDYHLILGAGLYTFIYIVSRAAGKYFGARFGASITHMSDTVRKYLGLTLLPHSGVSLVFTGIICQTLQASRPDLASLVKGTIAAAAIINEIIAVFAAKKGFELAGEIQPVG